jgi:hypothetical protein
MDDEDSNFGGWDKIFQVGDIMRARKVAHLAAVC